MISFGANFIIFIFVTNFSKSFLLKFLLINGAYLSIFKFSEIKTSNFRF